MFLEKLEIQGFKSFANKNTLVFPGLLDENRRGITSIVGPNGSGKSNIADAVRWALGEQSMKTLRGKKSEDIIFSGSAKLGKLSLAEVSLFLNNEDHKAPLDYSQIILTRRIYRDGLSEYLINNNRVRLSDVQIILAKANFGQKTYSVIGQGLVEGFLNTTLSERKEFFDEATGVKQFQIKRDDSLNKLILSYENLNQVSMLLAEIEPRLKSLTRQVNKLKKRDEIEAELKKLELNYYSGLWHELNGKFSLSNKELLGLERIKQEKLKKNEQLNRELSQLEKENLGGQEFAVWQKELNELQNKKEILNKQAARLEAELEVKLEAKGQFDLSWLVGKSSELSQEIKNNQEETGGLENNIGEEKKVLAGLKTDLDSINGKINKLNQNILRASSNLSGGVSAKVNQELKELNTYLLAAELENNLAGLKKIIKQIKEKLAVLLEISGEETRRENLEDWQKNLMALTAEKEALMNKINESSFRISARSERVKLITERRLGLANELAEVNNKLQQNRGAANLNDNKKERQRLKREAAELDGKISGLKEKLTLFNAKENEQKSRLFALQKNLQVLQNEINGLANRLNKLNINSARLETRLADLEIEIRNNYGNLKDIKDKRPDGPVDETAAWEKITSLKRQIDQIGGLDPETEKEYLETKERYDYLENQIHDLNGAVGSLEKIIKELDAVIKKKFDEKFKNISVKFEEYFKILFNGGQAKIVKVLTEDLPENKPEENKADEPITEDKFTANLKRIKYLQKYNSTGLAGIEIIATPPGKKIKAITMLSGGERALTAIGLICAIISCNPAPFVILDEVDASLDEANSERLAKILDDLSHKTQFIVITHNRASMRRANILYGVTMAENGVSKLLSIKLDQASKAVRK
ncbi:MAG: chromosome segregation protein SMC [Parcubacteria group bacterium]|nr:chromosome segregation protein SMC [Parcubacteria group bacterium]